MRTTVSLMKQHYLSRVTILLVLAALIAGMVGCSGDGSYSYYLGIYSTSGGSVTVPGEGSFRYSAGAVVSLVAQPDDGYHFVDWTGDVGTIANVEDSETNITMNNQWYIITANFGSQIHDWYDLDAIRGHLDCHHILMNTLDSGTPGYEEIAGPSADGGRGWQPIGTEGDPFVGTFDGQGYQVRALFVDRPSETGVGLFGFVDSPATIKNVGVLSLDVTGGNSTGSLVGTNSGADVTNCFSSGSVSGASQVGSLVGANLGGVLSDCYSAGVVVGGPGVGGLVGDNGGTVNDCYSSANVTGVGCCGGLAGVNGGGVLYNSCASGSVSGGEWVGGLVGWNYGSVTSCYYFIGSVVGFDGVGGLAGLNGGATLRYSYSSGGVEGNSKVGGLVGWNSYADVSKCYSVGNVTGDMLVGGLVGWNNEGTATNSFWDTETSGQATSDGGIGKTTAQMRDIATFSVATWDIVKVANPDIRNIDYIWNIVDDVTYPFLSWQT